MLILLRQIKTGLYLAPDGRWTSVRSEARRFKKIAEVVSLMPVLAGPLEVYYDVGDERLNFAIPLQQDSPGKDTP